MTKNTNTTKNKNTTLYWRWKKKMIFYLRVISSHNTTYHNMFWDIELQFLLKSHKGFSKPTWIPISRNIQAGRSSCHWPLCQ